MRNDMSRPVYLAVYDSLADWETGHAVAHIGKPAWQRQPGRYRVVTVGETLDPVTTLGGVRILPECTLAEAAPESGAMLILPGSDHWMTGGLTAFGRKAREFAEAGVPVAAICGAVLGLAAEGLLDDRDHTAAAPEFLAACGYAGGSRYREEPAVTDRNVITASPVAPVEFAREILAALQVYRPEVLDAWYRLFAHAETEAYHVLAAAG